MAHQTAVQKVQLLEIYSYFFKDLVSATFVSGKDCHYDLLNVHSLHHVFTQLIVPFTSITWICLLTLMGSSKSTPLYIGLSGLL